MRSLSTILVALLYLYFASMANANDVDGTFVLTGYQYSPYDTAILTITSNRGQISGVVEPLLGDTTTRVAVTGFNDTNNHVRLAFNQKGKTETYEFLISRKSDIISLQSDQLVASRPIHSKLSEASKSISLQSCGPAYGSLELKLNAGYRTKLASFLSGNPSLGDLPVTTYTKDKARSEKLSAAFLHLDRTDKDNIGHRIDVPIGSESDVARLLRESKIVSYINLLAVDCDGSDMSFYTARRASLYDGDQLSKIKTEDNINEGLRAFAGHSQTDLVNKSFRIAGSHTSTIPFTHPLIVINATLYVSSTTSRQVPGFWDKFTVHLTPAVVPILDDDKVTVVVDVDDFEVSKKSLGSDEPPDDSFYRQPESHVLDEGIVASRISGFLARKDGGWCVFADTALDAQLSKNPCRSEISEEQ